ncbi:hypothetical protein [Actinacidiphila sp. bgisy144]|uniref:hypothetical protein n=1 Tax=Actinacidiphila sp. bgisy144 TaxID=3413791 RepID=UPI003EBF33B6
MSNPLDDAGTTPRPCRPPSAAQIATALDVLDQFGRYLHSPTVMADALPPLAQVLNEEYGMPMVLGTILRNAAQLIEGHALLPWPVEIRRVIARLRAAAPEVTDCHDLHWGIHHLSGYPFGATDLEAPDPRSDPPT